LLEAWNRYVATGDEATFMEVYDTFYEDTLHFATAKCRNSHIEVADVVSEVWNKLWRKKPRIKDNIRSYLLSMTQHAFIDLIRVRSKFELHENPETFAPELEEVSFSNEEILEQHDFEIQQCLNEGEYKFIRKLAKLLIFKHTKKEIYQQLSETFDIKLQTVSNKRSLIMKKLETCRTNRGK